MTIEVKTKIKIRKCPKCFNIWFRKVLIKNGEEIEKGIFSKEDGKIWSDMYKNLPKEICFKCKNN